MPDEKARSLLDGEWELLLSCEHATNRVPDEIRRGRCDALLDSHVAWDPGAEPIATHLGRELSSPPLLGQWSRLVADLNRSPQSPEAVPERAFGEEIPWNKGLSPAERALRIQQYHKPYWDAAAGRAGACQARKRPLLHLAIHSFTPVYRGSVRDLDIGLLFDPDRPKEATIAELLAHPLEASGFVVRNNQPYDGRDDGLGQALRGTCAEDSYVHVAFEINHRLLAALPRVASELVRAIRSLPMAFTREP